MSADIVYMDKTTWQNLLGAIRAKGGTSGTMTAAQAKTAVDNIPTGGGAKASLWTCEYIFRGSSGDSIDVTMIDTSRVTQFASCFYSCGHLLSIDLTSWIIPSNANLNRMFYDCWNMKSVTFGPSTGTLGTGTGSQAPFFLCSALTTLRFKGTTPPTLSATSIIPSTVTAIYVPAAAVEDYKAATNWSAFASIISADPEE